MIGGKHTMTLRGPLKRLASKAQLHCAATRGALESRAAFRAISRNAEKFSPSITASASSDALRRPATIVKPAAVLPVAHRFHGRANGCRGWLEQTTNRSSVPLPHLGRLLRASAPRIRTGLAGWPFLHRFDHAPLPWLMTIGLARRSSCWPFHVQLPKSAGTEATWCLLVAPTLRAHQLEA